MTEKQLFLSMREIDETYILNAAPKEKKAGAKAPKSTLIKWGSVAAALCLILAASILLPLMQKPKTPDIELRDHLYTAIYVLLGEGGSMTDGEDKITYLEFTFDDCVVLRYEKKSDKPAWILIEGGLAGKAAFATTDEALAADVDFQDRLQVRGIKLYVDGVPAEDLPTAPGDYEIKISYRELIGQGMNISAEGIQISGYDKGLSVFQLAEGETLPPLESAPFEGGEEPKDNRY